MKGIDAVLVPGTVVAVCFHHRRERPTFLAKIIAVKERLAIHLSGRRARPLVIAVRQDTDEELPFDASYITGIVKRGTKPPATVNVYSSQAAKYGHQFRTKQKGVWCGPLAAMVETLIGRMPISYPRYINHDRLWEMFERDRPGTVEQLVHPNTIVYVNRKAFMRWVRANARRFMTTKREKQAAESRIEQDFDHELELAIEDDWRMLEESFAD